jgi:hypothetical protein
MRNPIFWIPDSFMIVMIAVIALGLITSLVSCLCEHHLQLRLDSLDG